MSFIELFDKGWSANPNGIAYRMGDEVHTFSQARSTSSQIAHALHARGVGREIPCAVLSPNSPMAWLCVLGIWRAGAAWVPLNPDLPAGDLADLMQRFDVEVLIYHPDVAPLIHELRAQLTRITTLICLDDGADQSLTDFINAQPTMPPRVDALPDDMIMLAPTGGTTGAPKGVMNTNRNMSVMAIHQMLALSYEVDEPIVNLAAAPMTHTAGMLSMHATARGGTVEIIERASPDAILEAIERAGVTDVFLPPTVVYRILDTLEHRSADTRSLRYVLYGAAPMSVEKLRRGITRLGAVFCQAYGQMEAPAAVAFMRPSEHLHNGEPAPDEMLSACGRPYPLATVAIVDPLSNTIRETGETGEIRVKGDLLMKGYYRDPQRTADTIVDGWLRTGDMGHLDSNGYLHITDRAKDVIISGGFNIYPTEIEQVIWTHPAVLDCAVVGSPHSDWGEAVTAVVELNPGSVLTDSELISFCREQLGSTRTPKSVIFVDELPRSANGKVLKKDVRAPLWTDAQRAI